MPKFSLHEKFITRRDIPKIAPLPLPKPAPPVPTRGIVETECRLISEKGFGVMRAYNLQNEQPPAFPDTFQIVKNAVLYSGPHCQDSGLAYFKV